MKQIKFQVEYSFDFKRNYHKIIASIVFLLDENKKVSKSSIKEVLKDVVNITGFIDNISFSSACAFIGVNDYEYSDLQDKINIVSDAIEIYNKIYKQNIKLEDIELE